MATPSKPPPIKPQAPSETATLPPSVPGDAVTLPPPPARSDSETLAPSGPAAVNGTAATVPGYEILRELGRGGMGVVYQARHIKLNRPVALKMILAGGHAGAADLARFQTEAEAIARLRHPNIVQVYEVGEHEGKPFFSLEFCDGGSLDKKLAGTPLPPREAAALVETLARAMQAAHEQQVIHRDLKPANVLLAEDGTPKIADFGLAKKLDEAGQTASGAVMGTPSYMAPEQAGGKSGDIGPLADVYALGAILYECLTGRPPFKSATALDTILQVVSDEPVPPTRLQTKTPRDLETVCLKCLQKEAGKRYASARELADDLRRFLGGEPIRVRPVGRAERTAKWVKRNPVVAALLAAVVLSVLGGASGIVVKYLDAKEQEGIARAKAKEAADEAIAARKAETRAEEKEKLARQEADKARKARDFLVRIFELSDARTQTGTLTPRQILDDAERRIPREFADQPELQAELQTAIDGVYEKITHNAPLAMLLEVQGTVRLQSSREPGPRPVPQTLLYAGDRLHLADDAQARLVVLSDLHQEWLHPGREVTVRRKGCEPAEAVRERSEDILMTFARLPKGTFYMGWGNDVSVKIAKGWNEEIKEDFEIAVHDVTQGQWQAVMGENPSFFSRFGGGRNEVKDTSDEELKLFPVESVSWDDAQAFLKKLNEKEAGRGYWYRLPTEAEWEYACRGGATSLEECSYHFYFNKPTNDLSSAQANFDGNIPFGKAKRGPYLKRTTRVGAYPSNKLGLCDMHGNVSQWCENNMYDPKGSERERGYRGGYWNDRSSQCRAAMRNIGTPTIRVNFLGLRLVRIPVR